MTILLTKTFQKAFRKLDATAQRRILTVIREVENAHTLQEVGSVQPMTGYPNFFRIREGAYRVGIFLNDENVVEIKDVGPRRRMTILLTKTFQKAFRKLDAPPSVFP